MSVQQKQAYAIAAALRSIAPQGKLASSDVPHINALAALWAVRDGPTLVKEPAWLVNARSKLGRKEIAGSQHNGWIVDGWKRLGAGWYNDDETPWCGFFVADCLNDAGLPFPKNFPSAASFRDYGIATAARLGAIGVKARTGGNHVFFIVGETPDKRFYKALGGNQGNMVNIVDIAKTDVNSLRWPSEIMIPSKILLPQIARGTISGDEA